MTTPSERDRHLRRVGRLRFAVVSAGVVGSLGVAGVVAASGSTTAAPDPTRPADADQARGPAGDSFSGWQGDRAAQPGVSQGLGQGSGGPSHGSTGGS